MFSQHPRIAERWADHTPDMKDLPEKLSAVKTAGFWAVLIKLGAVDPTVAKNVARVAKRMGVKAPSRSELKKMFPPGWEAANNGSWQAQFEQSDWLRDVNTVKAHAKDVAAGRVPPTGSKGSWTQGPGWKSQSVPVASRVARGIMSFPGLYGLGGLLSLKALIPGTRKVMREAKKGLEPEAYAKALKKTVARGVGLGALGGGILGMGIPLLANIPQMRSAGGLRNILRIPGVKSKLISSGLITGLFSTPWGATAGGLVGSRFLPGAAAKAREQQKAAAEETSPAIPENYLTNKFTVPSGIFGGVSGGIDPPLRIAIENFQQARAGGHKPSVGSLFKKMPPDLKKQMLKGGIRGVVGGLLTGYITGRVSDTLIQKKLEEKSV